MSGIKQIAAIHRGFFQWWKIFRNRPTGNCTLISGRSCPVCRWSMTPPICGRRDLLKDVAQKAMDLNFHGLMLESHITQTKPGAMPNNKSPRKYMGIWYPHLWLDMNDRMIPASCRNWNRWEKIDLIDDELLHILASRMKISREIGRYKRENEITILQQNRWKEILDKYLTEKAKFRTQWWFCFPIYQGHSRWEYFSTGGCDEKQGLGVLGSGSCYKMT